MTQASVARANDSFRDPRVRAPYAISPAVIDAMSPRGAQEIGIPLRDVVRAETHARVAADAHAFFERTLR